MAGRVHGRVEGGRVFILSDRDIRFDALRPVEPEFQLAGDSERVAMTCADLGVDAAALDLPVPLDRVAYRQAVELLQERGIIEEGRLSRYGKQVEAMPVDRPWAELLVNGSDRLGAAVFPEEDQCRIAGRKVDKQEHADGHQEGDRDHQREPAQDVRRHAGSLPSIRSK
jgi:hypothetical protein